MQVLLWVQGCWLVPYLHLFYFLLLRKFSLFVAVMMWTAFLSLLVMALYIPANTFMPLLLITIAFNFVYPNLLPAMESSASVLIQNERIHYGKSRSFGSIGYTVGLLLIGAVVAIWSEQAILWVMLTGLAFMWISHTRPAPVSLTVNHKTIDGEDKKSNFKRLLSSKPFVTVLILAILLQGAHASYYNFGYIYLQDLGVNSLYIGLVLNVAVLLEILFFTRADKLFANTKVSTMFLIAGIGSTIRWVLIFLFPNVWVFNISQLFHAASFGVAHYAFIQYISRRLSPSDIPAAQGMYAAFAFSLSTAVLTLAGGYLYARCRGGPASRAPSPGPARSATSTSSPSGFRRSASSKTAAGTATSSMRRPSSSPTSASTTCSSTCRKAGWSARPAREHGAHRQRRPARRRTATARKTCTISPGRRARTTWSGGRASSTRRCRRSRCGCCCSRSTTARPSGISTPRARRCSTTASGSAPTRTATSRSSIRPGRAAPAAWSTRRSSRRAPAGWRRERATQPEERHRPRSRPPVLVRHRRDQRVRACVDGRRAQHLLDGARHGAGVLSALLHEALLRRLRPVGVRRPAADARRSTATGCRRSGRSPRTTTSRRRPGGTGRDRRARSPTTRPRCGCTRWSGCSDGRRCSGSCRPTSSATPSSIRRREDFFAVANEVSGQDLTWFFDQVHRSSNVFDYAVDVFRSEPADAAGTSVSGATASRRPPRRWHFRTTVVVRRLGEGVFPVDVRVRFENGEEQRWHWDGTDRWKAFEIEKPVARGRQRAGGSRTRAAAGRQRHQQLRDARARADARRRASGRSPG